MTWFLAVLMVALAATAIGTELADERDDYEYQRRCAAAQHAEDEADELRAELTEVADAFEKAWRRGDNMADELRAELTGLADELDHVEAYAERVIRALDDQADELRAELTELADQIGARRLPPIPTRRRDWIWSK